MTRLGPGTEYAVHRQICEYVRLRYPDVIFNSDGAGIFTTPALAGMQSVLKSRRGYPDVFFAEPIGRWHGLYIEVKREGATVTLKDGTLSKNAHIQEQAETLQLLRNKGYMTSFGVGFAQCQAIIDSYLGGDNG
jgi:hypothetical protein